MTEMHRDTAPVHRGHETRDVDIRAVALCALGLAVVLGGSLALMAWVFDFVQVTPAGPGPRGSGPLNWAALPTQSQGAPIATTPPRPPAPRLQTSPRRDLEEMRRAENAQLQNYGWVDRLAGMVRIPIDRAMQTVVEQGLPSWHEIPTPSPATRGPTPEER